jgi:large conductance mechanosensitive channel
MIQDFKKFLIGGNVVDMAVGFMFGGAFATIVKSLVDNIIMPPVGLLLGKVDFSNLFLALDGNTYANIAALEAAGAPAIRYGAFINNMVSFIILGFIIFMMVRFINKLKKKDDEAPKVPPTEIILLTEIRDALAGKK